MTAALARSRLFQKFSTMLYLNFTCAVNTEFTTNTPRRCTREKCGQELLKRCSSTLLHILKRLTNRESWTIDSRGRNSLTKFMKHVIPECFYRESRLESGPPIKTFGGDKFHLQIGRITICEPVEYKRRKR